MTLSYRSSTSKEDLQSPFGRALHEWRSSSRLRWGLRLILGLGMLWVLLVLGDQAQRWRAEATETEEKLERIRPVLGAKDVWARRAEQARLHLEAARTMLWPGTSQGLVEASLQDLLKTWSEKMGLTVREVAIVPSSEKAHGPIGVVKARLVVEASQRLPIMGLLSELDRSPQRVMVERIILLPSAQPVRAELELRVLFSSAERPS